MPNCSGGDIRDAISGVLPENVRLEPSNFIHEGKGVLSSVTAYRLVALLENVFESNLIVNGVEGYMIIIDGAEYTPKFGNCCTRGTCIIGAGSPETTNVVFMVTEPVLSVAVISIIGAVLASEICGVPEKVLVAPSSVSHEGALDSVYFKGSVEVNVEAEKVKLNADETLATGGTCELIGKVIVGIALTSTTLISVQSTMKIDIADFQVTVRTCT